MGKRLARGGLVLVLCAGWLAMAPPAIAAEPDSSAGASGASDLATVVARLQRHYQETQSFDAKFKEIDRERGWAPGASAVE